MKNLNYALGIVLSFVFVLSMASRVQACDRTSLTLNGITPLAGGQYALSLRFCVGAGKTGTQYGAANDTYTFAFFTSQNASFASYPAQIVSPQTGYVYIDTMVGGDTLIYFSENYFAGPYEPWACINNCGDIQTVCMDISIITNGLPDSLWMGGAEAGGNIAGGCDGPDMFVFPSCPVVLNPSMSQPVCPGSTGTISLSPNGGTPPYSFAWSNGATTSTCNNLTPGTYTVTVSDASACSKIGSYVINSPNLFTMDLGANKTVYRGYSPMSCALLVPSMVGGQPPFTYAWSNGSTAPSTNVCPIATTTYSLTVTDSRGCQLSDNIQVNVVDVRCGSNNQKVLVCHGGGTICIPQSQVAAHLNHGDVLGTCPNKTGEAGAALDDTAMEYSVSAYPVPASDRISFRIQTPDAGAVTLEVFDLQGLRVAILKGEESAAGESSEMEMHVAGWAPGIYLARLSHPVSGVQNLKFTVVK